MILLISSTQLGGGNRKVFLGSGQACMAEQLFYGLYAGSPCEKVGGETVSQGMRMRARCARTV